MHSFSDEIVKVRAAVAKAVLGKEDVIENVIIALLAQGHLLIEDVPGVGKTTLALALAQSIEGSFHRIQFTSDLLPSDVLGVTIFNTQTREFEFKRGPIFANVVLADEINRTTPKTQSALLEAMQDGRITVERKTHDLPNPFMVLATQNPIEFHGTYPLPESQLDRFLMRISIGYPESGAEVRILASKDYTHREPVVTPVVTGQKVLEMQRASAEVKVNASIAEYMVALVQATRNTRELELGVSTRGSLALYRACQARAFSQGRLFVTPDDVKSLAKFVLAHRIILSSQRSASSTSKDLHNTAESIIGDILDSLEVPV